jgi:glycine/D-amino acid oxidase-like deaminating enzyme
VAVVEKEIAGFGASGRNGGWCSPNFSVTATGLEKRFGAEAARNLLFAMRGSVDEVDRVCGEENIDARFHKGGVLTLARGRHQLQGIRSSYQAYERLRLGDRYRLLTAEEAGERIRVTGVHGALIRLTARAYIRHVWCVAWRARWKRGAGSFTSRRQ